MRKRKEIAPLSSSDKVYFDKFYDDYKKFIFYTARKYTNVQSECEDIVQDTVERLLYNVSTLSKISGSRLHKYIALTVRAAFLDNEKRKHSDSPFHLDDTVIETLVKADIISPDDIPDLSAQLEVERLKRELPYRDWVVLEGKYILGYTQEELGDLIGVAPDSIRMIICRAKGNARSILQSHANHGGE